MAKKGFFSWFRKDKNEQEVVETSKEVVQDVAQESIQDDATQAQASDAKIAAEAQAAEEAKIAAAEAQAAEEARIFAAEAQAAEEARIVAAEAQAAEEAKIAAAEAQAAEEAKIIAAEAQTAEEARIVAAEAQAAEEARIVAAEAQAAEEARIAAAEAQAAEEARIAAVEAQAAEEARIAAAEAQAAEEARIAAVEAQAAEEARIAAVEAQSAEEARIAAAEAQAAEDNAQGVVTQVEPEPQDKPKKEGMFARLKRGLMRTSENIGSGFIGLFSGKKIDDDLFEELEEQLLIADVGVETTTKLIKSLTEQASRKQLKNAEALYDLMRDEMHKMLAPVAIPLVPDNAEGPFVILMVGVNGVGKTTTIGKLAKQYQKQGKSVMLAAGDTFRAAAVEQLQVWGQRNNIPVVAQHTGADSASVIFDALQAAKARKVDVLIADTAGRLQNKSHLMEELKKVVRVMKKLDINAPHEVMLTLDASTGQNAISQAQLFQEAVGVTGITLSKLDGTAKGGIIFAIADKFNIPIRHIGVGEQIDDLRTFNAHDFIEALFSQEKAE
ncbi:signal recognition particle-docking protein FtsY [Shewanella glacialimarina]|uniref:signal recognition particle-docking protein FtsY n=1 Tax=Shewanella glacialimarina TaxID=2590884 RepID=UPI001CF927D6|nr:signal recognition particle-docking protein FtsY [Shewanella glacialimarina]UCX06287.1 signal recognition particle-docking protein FtsY [Shewanella glacialimarina]